MKPVQVILDAKLVAELDRAARRRRVSRSAFIRESLEAVLRAEQMRGWIDQELEAYGAKPRTAGERQLSRALSQASERAHAMLSGKEKW